MYFAITVCIKTTIIFSIYIYRIFVTSSACFVVVLQVNFVFGCCWFITKLICLFVEKKNRFSLISITRQLVYRLK